MDCHKIVSNTHYVSPPPQNEKSSGFTGGIGTTFGYQMMHGNVSVIPQNEVGFCDFESSCLKKH